jgi:hypothetical protein
MALERIYAQPWARQIESSALRDEQSSNRARNGLAAARARWEEQRAWRLTWQSCDIREAK